MDTRRPWDLMVRIGIFIIATLGGFLGLVLVGMIVWAAFVRSPLSNSSTEWLLGAAAVGALVIGAGIAYLSPRMSAANQPPEPAVPCDEIEAPPVTARIEDGPPGTKYLAIGTRMRVTASNRNSGAYLQLAVGVAMVSWVTYCIWNPSPHVGFAVFISFTAIASIFRSLLGSTTITVQGDTVEVLEGIPGIRSIKSLKRADAARVVVRRYKHGRSTTTKAVIEGQDGAVIIEFGRVLPWTRLCYLKQVVEAMVLYKAPVANN